MILESLVGLAKNEKLMANPDYEPKPVAWIIALGEGGKFLGLIPTTGEAEGGKKPKARLFSIPRRKGRTSGASADFLVDKSEYVLGIEPEGKRSEADLHIRRDLFRRSVSDALAVTGAPALAALASFLESEAERSVAVSRITDEGYQSNDLIAFQFGEELVHDAPEIQAYFAQTRRSGGADAKQCLICGHKGIPVDKHPSVRVPGGTTSGVALVSFNSEAFESYGLERNENASVCRDCADGYTTALNRLLSDRYIGSNGEVLPRRFVRLSSDTTAVFWADEDAPLLDLFSSYFEAPRSESVEALLRSPYDGRAPAAVSNRFYCLILSGGQGRAVLRGMHTGTVSQVEENLRRYFESINIGSEQPLPLQWLLRSLVLQGKLEHLPPGIQTDVFLAILFGGRFPRTLLARAVDRCRAEQEVPRARAAVLRAYLIRNERLGVNVGLDKENTNPGYRLGRLMAILERVQAAAQNNPNKTIVDRYYTAASTRPATVFPRLIELAQHHLAKLSGGLAGYYQAQVGEIVGGLASLPATLRLEEQGLFALGYYHQRYSKQEKASEPQKDTGEGEGE